MVNPTSEVIEIEVFDRRYPLRVTSAVDRQQVLDIAAEVDRRMRDISNQTRTVDSLKVAVLTALHLVEEMRDQTTGSDEFEKAVRNGSRKWIREIDKVL